MNRILFILFNRIVQKKYLFVVFLFFVFCFFVANFSEAIVKRFLKVDLIEQLVIDEIPSKIWLHRCNSKERLAKYSDKYEGLEIDIIFYEDQGKFEASHDIEDLDANNLEKILHYYFYNRLNNQIWFDFKNLDSSNMYSSERVLSELMRRYDVDKEKLIIESRDWRSLGYFKKSGYRTSYYFPYYEKEELNNSLKEEVVSILRSGNVDYVSFYVGYYDFIKDINFPSDRKMLVWINNRYWYEVLYSKEYRELMNDDRVSVVLTKERKLFR